MANSVDAWRGILDDVNPSPAEASASALFVSVLAGSVVAVSEALFTEGRTLESPVVWHFFATASKLDWLEFPWVAFIAADNVHVLAGSEFSVSSAVSGVGSANWSIVDSGDLDFDELPRETLLAADSVPFLTSFVSSSGSAGLTLETAKRSVVSSDWWEWVALDWVEFPWEILVSADSVPSDAGLVLW